MSKATKAHIDALNQRENERQWKRNAAEDLYDALKKLMDMRDKCFIPNDGDWWDEMANAAIAKAEGRQP